MSLVLKVPQVFLHVVVEAADSLEVLKQVLEVTKRFQKFCETSGDFKGYW